MQYGKQLLIFVYILYYSTVMRNLCKSLSVVVRHFMYCSLLSYDISYAMAQQETAQIHAE